MTAETKEHVQSVEEELRGVERDIEGMEREMAEGAASLLRWEEITSTTAEDLARKEQRRGILPRLLQAARVRRADGWERMRSCPRTTGSRATNGTTAGR